MKLPVVNAVAEADILKEDSFKRFQAIVSAERLDRAKRFHRREDACRSLLAESLMKFTLLNSGLHMDKDIALVKNEFGKPVPVSADFHFNISHSGSWVICALDIEEIGVDVEKIHKVDSGISKRFFSPIEDKLLSVSQSTSQWLDCFYRLWVLKESYIKAIGKGLQCALNSFAVLPKSDGTAELIRYDESLPQKYFKIYDIDPAYKCALCCSHQKFPEKVNIITPEEILDNIEERFSGEKQDIN